MKVKTSSKMTRERKEKVKSLLPSIAPPRQDQPGSSQPPATSANLSSIVQLDTSNPWSTTTDWKPKSSCLGVLNHGWTPHTYVHTLGPHLARSKNRIDADLLQLSAMTRPTRRCTVRDLTVLERRSLENPTQPSTLPHPVKVA